MALNEKATLGRWERHSHGYRRGLAQTNAEPNRLSSDSIATVVTRKVRAGANGDVNALLGAESGGRREEPRRVLGREVAAATGQLVEFRCLPEAWRRTRRFANAS